MRVPVESAANGDAHSPAELVGALDVGAGLRRGEALSQVDGVQVRDDGERAIVPERRECDVVVDEELLSPSDAVFPSATRMKGQVVLERGLVLCRVLPERFDSGGDGLPYRLLGRDGAGPDKILDCGVHCRGRVSEAEQADSPGPKDPLPVEACRIPATGVSNVEGSERVGGLGFLRQAQSNRINARDAGHPYPVKVPEVPNRLAGKRVVDGHAAGP